MERIDEQLVAGYLAGEQNALEILIKRYLRTIYNFVYKRIGDVQPAEDITQDIFVKVWRNIKKFNAKKGSFKTWLFAIAKNTAIDSLKKKKSVAFSHFENEKGGNALIEKLASPAPLPDEIFAQKGFIQALSSALTGLSIKYRRVLFLRYNDSFTFQEIALLLGEPLNTVKSRHRRALIILKRFLALHSIAM